MLYNIVAQHSLRAVFLNIALFCAQSGFTAYICSAMRITFATWGSGKANVVARLCTG